MIPELLLKSLISQAGKTFGASLGVDLTRGMSGLLNGLGTSLSSMAIGGLIGGKEGLESMRNSITNQGLTGAQREANAFSAAEAQKARDFSEMQRQTQYQTAVNDMTAAGLNPAMMYQGAGAAASPTPSAAADSVAPQSNKITDMLSLISGMAQLKQIEAETKNIEANTNKTNIEAENTGELMQSEISLNKSSVEKNTAEIANLNQVIEESKSRVVLNGKELKVKDALIAVYGSEVTKNEADAALAEAQKFLANAEEWQIRELTPGMKFLNYCNAMLAQEKTLTEVEQQYYLRARTMVEGATCDLIRAQSQGQKWNNVSDMVSAAEDYQKFLKTKGSAKAAQHYLGLFGQLMSASGTLLFGAGALSGARSYRKSLNSPRYRPETGDDLSVFSWDEQLRGHESIFNKRFTKGGSGFSVPPGLFR